MGPGRKTYRVVRGGSWNNDNENNFRCAYRNNNRPDNRNDNNGFRVAVLFRVGIVRFMDCVSVREESRPGPGRKAK
jgi:hypothetical protein